MQALYLVNISHFFLVQCRNILASKDGFVIEGEILQHFLRHLLVLSSNRSLAEMNQVTRSAFKFKRFRISLLSEELQLYCIVRCSYQQKLL